MDLKRAVEVERVMMQGLIMLLLSLAALCDRTSADTEARRRRVLSILRDAPASALKLVSHHMAGFDLWLDLAPDDEAPQGDSPDETLQLAHHFRVLAQVLLQLMALLPQAERKPRCRDWPPLDPPLRSGGGGPCAARWRARGYHPALRARSRDPPLRVAEHA